MEKEKKQTPSQELKQVLDKYFVLNRDNLWGKKGEIVKHNRDFGSYMRENSEWTRSDGTIEPYVACDLKYCIDEGYVTPLYDYLKNNDLIKITDLSSWVK